MSGCKIETNVESYVEDCQFVPTVLSPTTSQSLGVLTAKSSSLDLTGTEKPVARGLNENAASSSQVRQ